MDHKPKSHSQNNVKTPGDGTPVEQWIGGGPLLHSTHHLDLRLVGIQRPFAQGIKQNIRRHGGGEDHHTPLERGVLGIFHITQFDGAEFRKSHIQGAA